MNIIEEDAVERALLIPGATFPNEVSFLYHMALRAPSYSTYVELGTYKGRTLTVLTYAAQNRRSKMVSIDNYQYEEDSCSLEEVRKNLEKNNLENSVRLIEGDSRQRPEDITSVGLLFVDSCHTKKHFDAEMLAWLDRVQKYGVVVCHDYNSPRWLEMTEAIDGWFKNKNYRYLGLERRMIAFQKLF